MFKIFRKKEKRAALDINSIVESSQPLTPPMALSTVYRCVAVISESVAMLPIYLYEQRGEAMYRLLSADNELVDVLNVAPDARMSRYTFMASLVRSLLLRGNAYAYPVRNRHNEVTELKYIHPDRVSIVARQDDEGTPYLLYRVTGMSRMLDSSELLHFIYNSDNGLVGESVLQHARRSLNIAGNAENQAKNYYTGNGMPSGVLTIQGRMTDEQRKQNYEVWESRMESKPGGVIILEGTQNFTPINISAADRQLLEVRAFSVADLCRFFGCSPVKAFDLSHSSYSTVEAMQLEFLTDTLQPMLVNIEMELHRKLFFGADAKKYAIKFNTAELLRADKSSQAQYYSQLVQLGLLTPNEARIELNLPPMKDGNALYMQGAMQPLSNLNNQNNQSNGNEGNQGKGTEAAL